ncbi:hypothetical protein [Nocardioides sp.]|uniref:hypothetical protein n=1 Tax=Nocardioides sp. TaxID=35761 RepID=UPI002C9334E3|nr:hypothetical protein [Nocardioides sp.]HXH79835.1 hypothetical protein [Nocardioides sp.]
MNDLDQLTDRLQQLGQHAPVAVVDPLQDVRRGRVALRRRHARSAVGVTTAMVAVGAVAATLSGLDRASGGDSTGPAGSPTSATSPTPTPTPTPSPTPSPLVCATIEELVAGDTSGSPGADQRDPEVAAALSAYREAAAATLDPSGAHLDPADNRRSNNIQSSSYCDPETGDHLTSLGTQIGWTGGGALGVIQVEVVSPEQAGDSQTVMRHAGWAAYTGQLPTGVNSVDVTNYSHGGGGHAVIVERADGITVGIDAAAIWGNNAAPGSAPATDLPGIDKLIELAARPELALPES